MSYEIGQVIYVIADERMEVIPLQVTEIQTTRSVTGTGVSYSVATPWKDDSGNNITKLSDLNDLGEVHTSIDAVRNVLLKKVTLAVEEIIARADLVAKVFGSVKQVPSQNEIQETRDTKSDDEVFTLPDGTLAKVGKIVMPEGM